MTTIQAKPKLGMTPIQAKPLSTKAKNKKAMEGGSLALAMKPSPCLCILIHITFQGQSINQSSLDPIRHITHVREAHEIVIGRASHETCVCTKRA